MIGTTQWNYKYTDISKQSIGKEVEQRIESILKAVEAG